MLASLAIFCLELFLIIIILNKIIIELIISTPIEKPEKSASYNCQDTIRIIAAEDKIITAENRKEIFLNKLPIIQNKLTLIKKAEKSPI